MAVNGDSGKKWMKVKLISQYSEMRAVVELSVLL